MKRIINGFEVAAGVKRRGQAGWRLDSERFRSAPRTYLPARGRLKVRPTGRRWARGSLLVAPARGGGSPVFGIRRRDFITLGASSSPWWRSAKF
jgi:hypothetical protein